MSSDLSVDSHVLTSLCVCGFHGLRVCDLQQVRACVCVLHPLACVLCVPRHRKSREEEDRVRTEEEDGVRMEAGSGRRTEEGSRGVPGRRSWRKGRRG